MKTNLKKQKECKMRLSVEVEAAEVEVRYQEVLRGVQGQAVLAGFRQGKAPLDLVEKRYVREVEEEVLKSLVPEVYHRAVQKHKASPVSLPTISEIKMERGHSLKFEAEFEVEPEIHLKNYKGIKIKKVSAEVRPEDLEKGMALLLESRAVQEGDLPEKKRPALDEAFAKQFGKETVEELKVALQKDLSRHKLSESHRLMKDELYGKLLTLANFSVPEGLAIKQRDRLLEQARNEYLRAGMPAARFEEDKARLTEETLGKAREQVKLYFILKKAADQEKIVVDEIELERRLTAIAEASKRPIEEARRVFEEDLRESMREKQTVDFLLANAKLEESKP